MQPSGNPSERETLLLPSKYTLAAISRLTLTDEDADEMLTMPKNEPEEEIFLSLIRVALKLHGDLMEKPGH